MVDTPLGVGSGRADELRRRFVTVAGRVVRTVLHLLVGGFITIVILAIYTLNQRPDLSLWHEVELEGEDSLPVRRPDGLEPDPGAASRLVASSAFAALLVALGLTPAGHGYSVRLVVSLPSTGTRTRCNFAGLPRHAVWGSMVSPFMTNASVSTVAPWPIETP